MTTTKVTHRWLPYLWALVLAVLMLGPALGRGYVLSYDMVWVPDLGWRSDFLGLGTGLPRAVPSDAVIALLDELIPSMVLQKVVLLGSLVGAAAGCLRLVGTSLTARLTAVSFAVWNPFVVERIWIGHWTVLLAYATLPWLVAVGRRIRQNDELPARLGLLLPLGSLSASAGLISGLALGVSAWRRTTRTAVVVGCIACANAPWVVSGLLHAGAATGVMRTDLFALHREGQVPAPLAVITMGGIWNAEVVPGSRTGVLGWVALVGLGGLALLGARRWWHQTGADEARRLLILAAIGYGLALLTWSFPAGVDWLGEHVIGGGILRDGTRTLALCLPLWVGLLSAGADRVVAAGPRKAAAGAAAVGCALLPVAVLPDAAWGIDGHLRPADFPADWSTARARVPAGHGDVLVLPFSSYRAPPWNGRRTVLDPLGRFLEPNYLVNDELFISGEKVPAEDPRVPEARRALSAPAPASRARLLARIGVRYVATERDVASPVREPRLAGRVVVDAPDLVVTKLAARPAGRPPSTAESGLLAAAWAAFVLLPIGTTVVYIRRHAWTRKR